MQCQHKPTKERSGRPTCRYDVDKNEGMVGLLIQYVKATSHGVGDIKSSISRSSNSIVAVHISDSIIASFFDVAISYRGGLSTEKVQISDLNDLSNQRELTFQKAMCKKKSHTRPIFSP